MVGFPGSGKSTFAKMLGHQHDYKVSFGAFFNSKIFDSYCES